MAILRARFRNYGEFLEAYTTTDDGPVLFVPTTTPLGEKSAVMLELACRGLPNKVLIRGTVLSWRPALPRLRVRAGVTVALSPEDDDKRRFVLATLSGAVSVPKRRHTRIPIDAPVIYRGPGDAGEHQGILLEISIGGGLLRPASDGRRPEPGDEITIELTPPGGEASIEIAAKVISLVPSGVGLKFIYRDGGGSRRIRELIRRYRANPPTPAAS